eukprot:1160493-Pelagomonas_calceolata.AAC.13
MDVLAVAPAAIGQLGFCHGAANYSMNIKDFLSSTKKFHTSPLYPTFICTSVDHVATTHDPGLAKDLFGKCQGGSKRVNQEELELLLRALRHVPIICRPAGSVPSMARNLAKILADSGGVRLVTACGDDANGVLFLESMNSTGVDTSQVLHRQAPTGVLIIPSCIKKLGLASANELAQTGAPAPVLCGRVSTGLMSVLRASLILIHLHAPGNMLAHLADVLFKLLDLPILIRPTLQHAAPSCMESTMVAKQGLI